MNQSQQDTALHNEYMECINTGATNVEALVQVAITNEMDVVVVFEALVRYGLHNPWAATEHASTVDLLDKVHRPF